MKTLKPSIIELTDNFSIETNSKDLSISHEIINDELKLKIEFLEKKINTIDTYLNNKSSIKQVYKPMSQKLDGDLSVFHQIDNQSSMQQNKSLLVLENENDLHKSNFKLIS